MHDPVSSKLSHNGFRGLMGDLVLRIQASYEAQAEERAALRTMGDNAPDKMLGCRLSDGSFHGIATLYCSDSVTPILRFTMRGDGNRMSISLLTGEVEGDCAGIITLIHTFGDLILDLSALKDRFEEAKSRSAA